MKDLLNEKLKAYRSLGPVLPEARKWLEDSNLWMLLYTVLCQRGVRIEKKTLVDILAGRIMEDVHIDLYGFCFRLRDVYKDMISAVEMQATLNTKMLDGWYEDLLEPEGPVHRRDNAVVYDIGFIPCPYFRENDKGLEDFFYRHYGLTSPAGEKRWYHGANVTCTLNLDYLYNLNEKWARLMYP